MLTQNKKRYLFSALLFLFLCISTVAGFVLLKRSQDNRQQASSGCPANDPYCKNPTATPVPTTVPGSELDNMGVTSTTYTGNRPNSESSCNGKGVWMNNFCYMPGDVLDGNYVILSSGRYNYPYIESKKVYESVNYGAETVKKVLGSESSLGKDCGGQGLAINGVCYAYGAVVNGYVIVPPRTSNCNNTTGDYCYAHLEKIEVPYDEWQAAVDEYEKTGNTQALEDLYKKTYGVSFNPGELYDPNAPNADLLEAQAIIASLTSASVLQQQAAAQNAELAKKGTLTPNEQAIFDFNQRIIDDKNLDTRYQVLDQLNDSASQQLTINGAVNKMYSDLVTAGSNVDLTKIATEQFIAIFGYDPSTKYGDVNGILGAFGIDANKLATDRANYAQAISAQTKDFSKLNEEYKKYVSGGSANIEALKKAAIEAGVITAEQVKNLSETDVLALLLTNFSDTTVTEAKQTATSIVEARTDAIKEQQLTDQFIKNQGTASSYDDLSALYTLYTGKTLQGSVTEEWIQHEIAKHSPQVALSLYAETQDVSYLQNYYANSSVAHNYGTWIPDDPKLLLTSIYGQQAGTQLYEDIVLPQRFNEAVANFSLDAGASLTSVCRELKVTDCNISSGNATETISLMLDKMYGDNANVNIPDLAVNYANQINSDVQDQQIQSKLDALGSMIAYSSAANVDADLASDFMDDYQNSLNASELAIEAAKIFNASDTFAYATANRESLSDYTWGLSYGNALMADNVFDREFTPEEMGLSTGQTINLTFNQLSSQFANVDVAQNIAANYATSKYYGYTGPADTGISNVALLAAQNLDVLDYNYQAADSGYYVDKTLSAWGEDLGAFMTNAGSLYAASQMNQSAIDRSLYTDAENLTLIDPIAYADQATAEFRADYSQSAMVELYENYIASTKEKGVSPVDQVSFEQFLNDPEIQRSAEQLNYERLEKVVAPAAAVVILPAMVASGVGAPILLGMSSSAFSLYQGAGMKAQALEIQRIDIQTRENVIVQSYRQNGASEQELADLQASLDAQVATLNQQGNLMLANAAVAAVTSAGGWLTSAANTATTANTASLLANSGQVLTKIGQAGGIALNSYNAYNSGVASYNAFSEGNIGGGIMSGISSFVAASGVAGNTFGLLGPTTYTNKIDYVLDAMNVPAGAAVDAQQVAVACFGSGDTFSQQQCTNAWIGLALSAGQNVSQIASSRKAYLADVEANKVDIQTAQIADIQKQIDVVGTEILALKAVPDKTLAQNMQLLDLTAQHAKLTGQIAAINPNIKIVAPDSIESYLATRDSIVGDLELKRQAALTANLPSEVAALTRQIEVLTNKTAEVTVLREQIASIDKQVTENGFVLKPTELADLQQQRESLVKNLETAVKDLTVIESIRLQNEAILQTVKQNQAFNDYKAVAQLDQAKAELVTIQTPDSEAVVKYQAEQLTTGLIKLETTDNQRLLSLAAVQENAAKLARLEVEKQKLLSNPDPDPAVQQAALARLDAEIAPLSKLISTTPIDNRSFLQKAADFFAPGKANREAYYKALSLTTEVEVLRAKLTTVDAASDEASQLKKQIANLDRQILDQKYVLANAAANPSQGIIKSIANFFPNLIANRQIASLKSAAKQMGTKNLEFAEQIVAKQTELDKLRSANDPTKNAADIARLEAEIADLNKTVQSTLRGTNALIAVDQSGAEGFTRYVVADTEAGRKSGIKQKQLDVLNNELKAFEQFRRDTGTPGFKIYSDTGSFKDQDVFLLAELEAFGAGRRGTVFGALPGMGKTDVVMPFNVLLKQRLTGESQFVVFPEAKLSKPWTTGGDNPIPNKDFIDYVESRFGEGSVLIVKANDPNVDPALIAKAKFIITTKDVAFDLQNTGSRIGLALRDKWRNSYVHADEVDWTFNPNENYKLSGTQVALQDKTEYSLYLAAQQKVLGIGEDGSLLAGTGNSTLRALINELEASKSIPEGITRTADGKGGKFADPALEKQVLSEWLDTWGGQSKIPDLDMSANVDVIRQKINSYLTTSTDAETHQHRAELAMINETVNFLSRIPGEDYGLSSNTKLVNGVEEIINSIAPREQNRETGRQYSAVAESLLYNTLGARILGVNAEVDLSKLTVGENGSEINYALLMLESQGFSLYTGTPETVAKLYQMAYGIELKVFSDSAVDDSIARFKASDSKVFASVEEQITARLVEDRDQVFINMAAGLRSNEVTLKDLVSQVGSIDSTNKYQKLFLVGASGKLTEYDLVAGNLQYVRDFPTTDDLNARTAELNGGNQRYIKFYEYGAHVGVDTKNNVDISRAVGICNGCDETTFSQGINRLRVQVEPNADGKLVAKSAPMDVVWLDAPASRTDLSIDEFASSIKDRQIVNEALAEVFFKETLLKNSVDGTFAELIDLAKNGKKGFLGFGTYKANQDLALQLEAAKQKWKETTQMNYLLGSDDLSAQAKLAKTAEQVVASYAELTKLLEGSGEPARLLAKRADGAVGDNQVKIAFASDSDYQVLGEKPSYRQIVNLINQSSLHLNDVNIAFTNRTSPGEVVGQEIAKTGNETPITTNRDDTLHPAPPADAARVDTQAVDTAPVVDAARQTNPLNIGFAAFSTTLGNWWNGKVDTAKLLAEKAKELEQNKQNIPADLNKQLTAKQAELSTATDEDKIKIQAEIDILELKIADTATIALAAQVETERQFANDYRSGGIKAFLAQIPERSGGLSISAEQVGRLLQSTDKFVTEEHEAEIEAEIVRLQDVTKAEKLEALELAKAEVLALETQKSDLQLQAESQTDGDQSVFIKALSENTYRLTEAKAKVAALETEIAAIDGQDYRSQAIANLEATYQQDQQAKAWFNRVGILLAGKVGKPLSFAFNFVKAGWSTQAPATQDGWGARLGQNTASWWLNFSSSKVGLFLVDRFNFRKAVESFQIAYNSNDPTWASKAGTWLAERVKKSFYSTPKIPMWTDQSLSDNATRILNELRAEARRQGLSDQDINRKVADYGKFFKDVPIIRLTDVETVDKLIAGQNLLSAYQVAGGKDVAVGHTSQHDIDRGLNHYVFGSWARPEGFSSAYGSTMVIINPSLLQNDSTIVTIADIARTDESNYQKSAVRGKDFIEIITLASIITHQDPLDAIGGQVRADKEVSAPVLEQIEKWQNFAEVKIFDRVSNNKIVGFVTNNESAKNDLAAKITDQKNQLPVYSQQELIGKNFDSPSDVSKLSWNIRRIFKKQSILPADQKENLSNIDNQPIQVANNLSNFFSTRLRGLVNWIKAGWTTQAPATQDGWGARLGQNAASLWLKFSETKLALFLVDRFNFKQAITSFKTAYNSNDPTWASKVGTWLAEKVNGIFFDARIQEQKRQVLLSDLEKLKNGTLQVTNSRPSGSSYNGDMNLHDLSIDLIEEKIKNIDLSLLINSGGSLDDLRTIIFSNQLAGVELPTEFPGKSSYQDWVNIRSFYLNAYISNPDFAKYLAKEQIKGAHGSTSASLLGVLQFGLLSQDQMKEVGLLIASGEGVFGSAGLNNTNLSFAQISNLDDAIRYSINEPQTVDFLAAAIAEITKTLSENPYSSYRQSLLLKKQYLEETLAYLQTTSNSDFTNLKKILLSQNFPVVYLTSKGGIPPLSGLESEYVIQDEVKKEEILALLVPDKYLNFVREVVSKSGSPIKVFSMESTNLLEKDRLAAIDQMLDLPAEAKNTLAKTSQISKEDVLNDEVGKTSELASSDKDSGSVISIRDGLPDNYQQILDSDFVKSKSQSFREQANIAAHMFLAMEQGKSLVDQNGDSIDEEMIRMMSQLRGSGYIGEVISTNQIQMFLDAQNNGKQIPLPDWLMSVKYIEAGEENLDESIDREISDFYDKYSTENRSDTIKDTFGFYSVYKNGVLSGNKSDIGSKLYFEASQLKDVSQREKILLFLKELKQLNLHPNQSKLYEGNRIVMYWFSEIDENTANQISSLAAKYGVILRGPAQDPLILKVNEKQELEDAYKVIGISNDSALGDAGRNDIHWRAETYDAAKFFETYLKMVGKFGKRPDHPYMQSYIELRVDGIKELNRELEVKIGDLAKRNKISILVTGTNKEMVEKVEDVISSALSNKSGSKSPLISLRNQALAIGATQDLVDSWTAEDQANTWITEQQRKFTKLSQLFNSLGLQVEVTNLSDYQKQLDVLSALIIEIDQLEKSSNLNYVFFQGDTKDIFSLVITVQDSAKFKSVDDFRQQAQAETQKLADQRRDQQKVQQFLTDLKPILSNLGKTGAIGALPLSAINENLSRVSEAISFFESFKIQTTQASIWKKLGLLATGLREQRVKLVELRQELKPIQEEYAKLFDDKSVLDEEIDLSAAALTTRIEELRRAIASKKEPVVTGQRTIPNTDEAIVQDYFKNHDSITYKQLETYFEEFKLTPPARSARLQQLVDYLLKEKLANRSTPYLSLKDLFSVAKSNRMAMAKLKKGMRPAISNITTPAEIAALQAIHALPGDQNEEVILVHVPANQAVARLIQENGLINMTGRDTLILYTGPASLEKVAQIAKANGTKPVFLKVPKIILGFSDVNISSSVQDQDYGVGIAIYNQLSRENNPTLYDQVFTSIDLGAKKKFLNRVLSYIPKEYVLGEEAPALSESELKIASQFATELKLNNPSFYIPADQVIGYLQDFNQLAINNWLASESVKNWPKLLSDFINGPDRLFAKDLLSLLKQNLTFKRNMSSNVEDHTFRVMRTFQEYVASKEKLSLEEEYMLLAFAFHDLTKEAPGVTAEDNMRLSAEIAEQVLSEAGIDKTKIAIIKTLVAQDHLGLYLQGKVSLDQTKKSIEAEALALGLDKQLYFNTLQAYYFADAGSYTKAIINSPMVLNPSYSSYLDKVFNIDVKAKNITLKDEYQKKINSLAKELNLLSNAENPNSQTITEPTINQKISTYVSAIRGLGYPDSMPIILNMPGNNSFSTLTTTLGQFEQTLLRLAQDTSRESFDLTVLIGHTRATIGSIYKIKGEEGLTLDLIDLKSNNMIFDLQNVIDGKSPTTDFKTKANAKKDLQLLNATQQPSLLNQAYQFVSQNLTAAVAGLVSLTGAFYLAIRNFFKKRWLRLQKLPPQLPKFNLKKLSLKRFFNFIRSRRGILTILVAIVIITTIYLRIQPATPPQAPVAEPTAIVQTVEPIEELKPIEQTPVIVETPETIETPEVVAPDPNVFDFANVSYSETLTMEMALQLGDVGLQRQVYLRDIILEYIDLQDDLAGRQEIAAMMPALSSGKLYPAVFVEENTATPDPRAVQTFRYYLEAKFRENPTLFPSSLTKSAELNDALEVMTAQFGIGAGKNGQWKTQWVQCVALVDMNIVLDPVDDQLSLPILPLGNARQVMGIFDDNAYEQNGLSFLEAWNKGVDMHGQYTVDGWDAWRIANINELHEGDLLFFGENHVVRVQKIFESDSGIKLIFTQANDPRDLYDPSSSVTTKGLPEVEIISEQAFLDMVGYLDQLLVIRSDNAPEVVDHDEAPVIKVEVSGNLENDEEQSDPVVQSSFLIESKNSQGNYSSYYFNTYGINPSQADLNNFAKAFDKIAVFGPYLAADEIRLTKTDPGTIPPNESLYALAGHTWVEGKLIASIDFTSDYQTGGHLDKLLTKLGLADQTDVAALVHEESHLLKYERDSKGNLVESNLQPSFISYFHGGLGSNESIPTDYAKNSGSNQGVEDFADSVTLYLFAPNYLKQIAPLRYEFIDYVAKGGDPALFKSKLSVNLSTAVTTFKLNTAVPPKYLDHPFAYYEVDGDKVLFTQRDGWIPIDSKIFPSYSSNRNQADYLKTLLWPQVEISERYTKKGDETLCNIYVTDVTTALGVPIPHWINGHEANATFILNWLQQDFAKNQLKWEMISAEEAQANAKLGIPTIAVTQGHIAMVRPGEGVTVDGVFYPSVSQAGDLNSENTTADIGFGKLAKGQKIYYFSNATHYELEQPSQASTLPGFALPIFGPFGAALPSIPITTIQGLFASVATTPAFAYHLATWIDNAKLIPIYANQIWEGFNNFLQKFQQKSSQTFVEDQKKLVNPQNPYSAEENAAFITTEKIDLLDFAREKDLLGFINGNKNGLTILYQLLGQRLRQSILQNIFSGSYNKLSPQAVFDDIHSRYFGSNLLETAILMTDGGRFDKTGSELISGEVSFPKRSTADIPTTTANRTENIIPKDKNVIQIPVDLIEPISNLLFQEVENIINDPSIDQLTKIAAIYDAGNLLTIIHPKADFNGRTIDDWNIAMQSRFLPPEQIISLNTTDLIQGSPDHAERLFKLTKSIELQEMIKNFTLDETATRKPADVRNISYDFEKVIRNQKIDVVDYGLMSRDFSAWVAKYPDIYKNILTQVLKQRIAELKTTPIIHITEIASNRSDNIHFKPVAPYYVHVDVEDSVVSATISEDIQKKFYIGEGALEQQLVSMNPNGCSDCSVVAKLVESSSRRIEALIAAGDNKAAIDLARQTNVYLQNHLFVNQPLQDQLLAETEYTEAVLVKNKLEQEEALRSLNRFIETLKALQREGVNVSLQPIRSKISETENLEVVQSPIVNRIISYLKFQLRNFAITLAYNRTYTESKLEQFFKQTTRASLWFRPFAIFFGEDSKEFTPFNLAVMEHYDKKSVVAGDPYQAIKQLLFTDRDLIYYLTTNQQSEVDQQIYQALLNEIGDSQEFANYDLDIKNNVLPAAAKSYLSDLTSQIFVEMQVDLSMGRYVAADSFYEEWKKQLIDDLSTSSSIEEVKQAAIKSAVANLSKFFESNQRFTTGSNRPEISAQHLEYIERLLEEYLAFDNQSAIYTLDKTVRESGAGTISFKTNPFVDVTSSQVRSLIPLIWSANDYAVEFSEKDGNFEILVTFISDKNNIQLFILNPNSGVIEYQNGNNNFYSNSYDPNADNVLGIHTIEKIVQELGLPNIPLTAIEEAISHVQDETKSKKENAEFVKAKEAELKVKAEQIYKEIILPIVESSERIKSIQPDPSVFTDENFNKQLITKSREALITKIYDVLANDPEFFNKQENLTWIKSYLSNAQIGHNYLSVSDERLQSNYKFKLTKPAIGVPTEYYSLSAAIVDPTSEKFRLVGTGYDSANRSSYVLELEKYGSSAIAFAGDVGSLDENNSASVEGKTFTIVDAVVLQAIEDLIWTKDYEATGVVRELQDDLNDEGGVTNYNEVAIFSKELIDWNNLPPARNVPSKDVNKFISIRGLPDGIFDLTDKTVEVIGLITGQKITREVGKSPSVSDTDQAVLLRTELDENYDKFYFLSKVKDGVISFDINTKRGDKTGEDFFAADLIARSIMDFRSQGIQISRYQSEWNRTDNPEVDSVNYAEFLRNLGISITDNPEEINKQLEQRSQEEIDSAIFNTWTGKVARSLGFKKIVSRDVHAYKITVVFEDVGDVVLVKDISSFASLCSDCNAEISKAIYVIQEVDQLWQEAETLGTQTKQGIAKTQAALKKLNDLRNQVINHHGYQNQLVQLYLDALISTREAMIRKTTAEADRAIDAVYRATVLAEEMLRTKQMAVKVDTFLGFGGKVIHKPLSAVEIDEIGDLLFGNKNKNIEGLQSFAAFDLGSDGKFSRTVLKGSLLKLENTVVADQLGSARIFLRDLVATVKQHLLLTPLIVNPSSDQVNPTGLEPKLSISPVVPSVTLSITPTPTLSPTPSLSPAPTADKNQPQSLWRILGAVLGFTLIGSVAFSQIPAFAAPEQIEVTTAQVVEQKAEPVQATVIPSPSPTPSLSPTPKPKVVEKPTEQPRKVKVVVLNTALPSQYKVKNPYAAYVINPDGTVTFIARDEWNPVDKSLFPDYTTNRNPTDYLKTIEFFQVTESTRYRRTSDETYCNIYVSDVTNALGVPIPRWQNGEKLNADGMYYWLQGDFAQDELGWYEISAEDAQRLANQGIPVVATTPSYDAKGGGVMPGHVAMVIPGTGETVGNTFYPASAQAGGLNFDDGTSTNIGFAGALNNGQTIRYFANESQYEFVQPTTEQ